MSYLFRIYGTNILFWAPNGETKEIVATTEIIREELLIYINFKESYQEFFTNGRRITKL